MTVAISLGSNFFLLAIDYSFDYAIGYTLSSLPWAFILWLVFDGDISESTPRHSV